MVGLGFEEVIDGAAVGGDEALESPVAAEDCLEKHLVRAGGVFVDGVVGAHDGVGLSVDNGGAEGRKISVPKIVRSGIDVGGVAGGLGTAVDSVVLGSGDGFEVGGVVALEAFDEGYAEAAGEERIFAVGLLASAPARIAED